MKNNTNNCYVIAEAGLNHNGSLNVAKKLIDVASKAGANAVKFQKRTVDKLATKDTLDNKDVRFPEFGSTYREIREKLEFNKDQYLELKKYSEELNLDFIVTAFDCDAVDFLLDINVEKFKLASHSLTNIQLLNYIASEKKEVILSTGMASIDEIDVAVKIFQDNKCPLKILHCVSAYPTPENECNLNIMNFLRERYRLVTGYSGHEIGYFPTLIAVSMGAEIVERHFTLDKKMIGFDHKISLEPSELNEMVKKIRDIDLIKGISDKKISDTEWITRKKYHVSIVSQNLIKKGFKLKESMITYRNPGTGMPAKDLDKILNKIAKKDIPPDTLLIPEMFE